MTPPVGPIKETHVPVAYDTDSGGFGGPLDMRGPLIGEVNYSQPGGNLLVKISLEFGQPNSKYRVFLVCGPAHALGCGFINIGVLATNAAGAGTVAITVPAAVLQGAPFGPGYRNDHLDLLGSDPRNSSVTAGAINYFVCKRAAGVAAAAIPRGMESVSAGDPLGTKGAVKAKARGKKR